MGLFSKKKTYVESYTLNLVEDTPNLVGQSVLASIRGNRPISDDLVANTVRGMGAKLKSFRRYGEYNYTYGLPEGTLNKSGASPETIAAAIQADQDIEHVHTVYSVYSKADPYYFTEDHLVQNRGYDKDTGIVSNPPYSTHYTVYLDSVEFKDSGSVYINYSHESRYGGKHEYVETYDLNRTVKIGANYYHAVYQIYNELEELQPEEYYWFYNADSKQYESLNPKNVGEGTFYPIVPVRMHKKDLTQDDDSERFQTSKRLCDRIGVNYVDVGKGVHESPDINDIDHAYVILGIKTTTENQHGKRYLFDFFKHQYGESHFTRADFERHQARPDRDYSPPSANILEIKEADTYDVEIGWLYIDRELKSGSIGKVKTCETEIKLNQRYTTSSYSYTDHQLILRKQLDSDTYEELTVVGLNHTNKIYNSHHIDTDLHDALDDLSSEEDKDGLVIPLSDTILAEWSMVQLNELGYDAPKIMFNAKVVKKLKWYETGFFKFVLTVVSIAITIASLGTMSATIGLAMGLTGTAAVIATVVVLAVVSIGVQYGVAYLADVLGLEFLAVLAIIAVAMFFNPAGSALTAQLLSAVQSGIMKAPQVFIAAEMQEIAEQMTQLQTEIDEYQEDLKGYEADTSTEFLINPWMSPDTTTGLAMPTETPDQYYQTRIHSGNMATFDLVHIENFVDNNLYLEGTQLHRGIKV